MSVKTKAPPLACVTSIGTRCLARAHITRMRLPLERFRSTKMSQMEFAVKLSASAHLPWEMIPDIDDGNKYEWYIMVGAERVLRPSYGDGSFAVGKRHYRWYDDKYGRFMVCAKTLTTRTKTMGEVYGGRMID